MKKCIPVVGLFRISRFSDQKNAIFIFSLALVAVFGQPLVSSADDFRTIRGGVTTNDNINRGWLAPEKLSDNSLDFTYTGGNRKQLSDTSSRSLSYDVGASAYQNYSGLSNLSIGGSYTFRRKRGLGPEAPWWSAGARGAYEYFNDSNRSNLFITGDLKTGKQFGDRLSMSGGYQLESRTASNSVFSQTAHNVSLGADYTLSESIIVYGGYRYRSGEITITVTGGGPTSTAILGSGYVKRDSADLVFPPLGPNGWAYAIDGTSNIYTLGMNFGLDADSSLDLSYEKQSTSTKASVNYDNNIFRLIYISNL